MRFPARGELTGIAMVLAIETRDETSVAVVRGRTGIVERGCVPGAAHAE